MQRVEGSEHYVNDSDTHCKPLDNGYIVNWAITASSYTMYECFYITLSSLLFFHMQISYHVFGLKAFCDRDGPFSMCMSPQAS